MKTAVLVYCYRLFNQSEMDPEDENGIYSTGISGNLCVPSSYANGAFYADEQDTFVAGTSPPSSPLAEGDDVNVIVISLTARMDWGSPD